jgi:hypothetical protein
MIENREVMVHFARNQRLVMPGLVPGIHVFLIVARKKDVDGRDKPGHDGRGR